MPQAVSRTPSGERSADCELFVSGKQRNHMHIAIEFITQLRRPASQLARVATTARGARKGLAL